MMPEDYEYCEDCDEQFPASELLDGLCSDCCRKLDDEDESDDTDYTWGEE